MPLNKDIENKKQLDKNKQTIKDSNNEKFVQFLNKKKAKEHTKANNIANKNEILNKPNSIKDFLSCLQGKIYGEERVKDIKNNKLLETNKTEVNKKEDSEEDSNNDAVNYFTDSSNENNYRNNKFKSELKLNSDDDENLKEIKQYYMQKNQDGNSIKELPKLIKDKISKNKRKSNEIEKIYKEEHPHIVYQIKRFDSSVTKQDIKDYFIEKVGKSNYVKIKQKKNEEGVFNGIILLEVLNNKEVKSNLTQKRILFKGKKLKISQIDI